jgi:predicted RNA methylase
MRTTKPRRGGFQKPPQIAEGAILTFADGIEGRIWGTWTWVKFPQKPPLEVLKAMPTLCGVKWAFAGKHQAWYAKEVVDLEQIKAALLPLLGRGQITDFPAMSQTQEALVPLRAPAPITPFSESAQIAARLRMLADRMQKSIDDKRNPAIAQQRPTRRRADIATSMAQDADRLERVQQVLYRLAEGHEQNTIAPLLKGIRDRAQLETLLFHWGEMLTDQEDIRRMARAGISPHDFAQARALIKGLVTPPGQESETARRIRELERNLLGRDIPGYFPTPTPLAERMVILAGIEPGQSVLEPSAGKGNIAMAVREHQPAAQLICIEFHHELAELLRLKGFSLAAEHDFLLHRGQYDRIVMNPPFEKFQDIAHVRHAYDCLAPGGRLVSIMGEGAFFRKERVAEEFRAWLETVHASIERLPDRSFLNSERSTGTATRLVVIDKPYLSLVSGTSQEHQSAWWSEVSGELTLE